jgi:LuxR family maltose regulon positive regulatory protein
MVRPRITKIFRDGLDHKLTLVSATAGFGKTTSVSKWLGSVGNPAAWLTLDREDNDPNKFWRYLIAALSTIDPEIVGRAELIFCANREASLERGIRYLINDIVFELEGGRKPGNENQASDLPWILVLEDYHVIKNERIHSSLNYFLDNLPPCLHLIINTRADPPLDLPKRRVRQTMVEVRTRDLGFTIEEAEQYLNAVIGLDLTSAQVEMLVNRTEGWIAGLQMAAIAMKTNQIDENESDLSLTKGSIGLEKRDDFVQTFSTSEAYIGEYLMDEVLKSLSEEVEQFLFQISILENFSAPLCAAIMFDGQLDEEEGFQTHCQHILDYLVRENLFLIPLDNQQGWFRYHRLFHDLLLQRLHQTESKGRIKALHNQAADWFERNGFAGKAVSHFLAADSYKQAGNILQQSLLASGFSHRDLSFVIDWLGKLPEELILFDPILCVADAWRLRTTETNDHGMAIQRLNLAHRLLNKGAHSLSKSEVKNIEIQINTLKVELLKVSGVSWSTVAYESEKVLASIGNNNTRLRGLLNLNLGQAYLDAGEIPSANQSLAEARRLARSDDDWNTMVRATYIQANIFRQQGFLNEAISTLRQVIQSLLNPGESVKKNSKPISGALYTDLGRNLMAQNHLREAEQLLKDGIALLETIHEPLLLCDSYISLARLRSIVGDFDEAFLLLDKVADLFPNGEEIVEAERVWHWIRCAGSDYNAVNGIQQWTENQNLDLDEIGEIPAVFHEGKWLWEYAFILARAQLALYRIQGTSETTHQLNVLMRFLDQQINYAKESSLLERVGRLQILQSLINDAIGESELALNSLRNTFKYFEANNHVRAYLNEGEAMASLLYRSVRQGWTSGFALKLLAGFESERERIGFKGVEDFENQHKRDGFSSRVFDPLSNRETEVLQLIAIGCSNREIARELVISPGTVKVHINHIYNKLRVHRRTQAVSKGRFYGILTSM